MLKTILQLLLWHTRLLVSCSSSISLGSPLVTAPVTTILFQCPSQCSSSIPHSFLTLKVCPCSLVCLHLPSTDRHGMDSINNSPVKQWRSHLCLWWAFGVPCRSPGTLHLPLLTVHICNLLRSTTLGKLGMVLLRGIWELCPPSGLVWSVTRLTATGYRKSFHAQKLHSSASSWDWTFGETLHGIRLRLAFPSHHILA